jgi:exonuclease family protein
MTYSYVALDVETANSFRGSICSIGLVKFQDGIIVDKFYTLINPETDFSNRNVSIHGIKADDVVYSPTFPEVRQTIVDFIGSDVVVAHYAQFDMGALKDVYDKYKLVYDDIKYICSCVLARVAMPGQTNYKLKTLSQTLSISLVHHNALSDAEASGLILNYLIVSNGFSDLSLFLKEYGYNKPGLLGRYGFLKGNKGHSKKNSNSTSKSGTVTLIGSGLNISIKNSEMDIKTSDVRDKTNVIVGTIGTKEGDSKAEDNSSIVDIVNREDNSSKNGVGTSNIRIPKVERKPVAVARRHRSRIRMRQKMSFYEKWWFLLIVAFVVFCLITPVDDGLLKLIVSVVLSFSGKFYKVFFKKDL